jgi:ankyrin repeat protein
MTHFRLTSAFLFISAQIAFLPSAAIAQTAPSTTQINIYQGLHKAAHTGDIPALRQLIDEGSNLEARDSSGRTPLHVAAYASHDEAVRVLAEAGAELNALENRAYDVVTIAAVANDFAMLDLALDLGASAANITSPYDGTALIAAAHLGYHKVVKRLIEGGAPLDHINNIGWTALIESVVLGDGGPNHTETARLLLAAGADKTIGDLQGVTPYEHAKSNGFSAMILVFESFS